MRWLHNKRDAMLSQHTAELEREAHQDGLRLRRPVSRQDGLVENGTWLHSVLAYKWVEEGRAEP